MPRIVSFLSAGTEIVAALGAGDQLVGRSHECDYPASVQELPIVSRPALELGGLTQAEIDSAVSARMRSGESLYLVDEELLRALEPDVILTQDLCQVCAPSGNELSRAITTLPTKPEVLYLTPRTLAEIDENILAVGRAIGREREALALVASNRTRLQAVREATRGRVRRRVVFLEWTDPFYCAGHWVPEMIEIAGGEDPFGRAGGDSVRIEVDAVQAFNPEIVVVAPCGFGLADAERLARGLPHFGAADVRAVDANAYFARPGPRYVDGVAVLGDLFQG
ncbi:MAG TPA: ABC transporter substrate-binding protein [Gemmatimonadaceae bacterium]|jgi:iron complex transport system substrate-binding protein|nr:ABC transporter substrate-binding protein [Gemmatimonadaceae bacterium]